VLQPTSGRRRTANVAVGTVRVIGVDRAVTEILARRPRVPPERGVLVGVSGIDASGKGTVAGRMVAGLLRHDQNAVAVNADGWLRLPHERFARHRPAEHFYEHALRLDEMFGQLILPLREKRTHCVVADFTEETARSYRKHTYRFEDVDVIVLEGIFLFREPYRRHYDLTFWVECSFETALERALSRRQENLGADETIRAYHNIYFPAQRIHMARDDPRASADFVIDNEAVAGWKPPDREKNA